MIYFVVIKGLRARPAGRTDSDACLRRSPRSHPLQQKLCKYDDVIYDANMYAVCVCV